MKLIKYLFLFSVIFASCQKEESFELPVEKGVLSMDIDGKTWQAENVQAAYISSILTVSGTTNDGRSIVFLIQNPKVGVFYNGIDDNGGTVMYNDPAHPNGAFLVSHGNSDRVAVLEITEIDFEKKVFSGKFSFDVEFMNITGEEADEVVIKLTNGKMANIEFGDESGNPNPNPNPGTGGASKWAFDGTSHEAGTESFESMSMGSTTAVVVGLTNRNNTQSMGFNFSVNGTQVQYPIMVSVITSDQKAYAGFLNASDLSDFSLDVEGKKIKFKFSKTLDNVPLNQQDTPGPSKPASAEVNIGY